MDQKKAKELLYVGLFKQQFAEFPAGEIVADETPDFFVRSPNRSVGIEVTRIFRDVPDSFGRPLQRRESELDQIVQSASARHQSNGLPPVLVSAFFSKHHDFGRAARQAVANSLADIIEYHLPECPGRVEVEYDPAKAYFSDRIDEVHIRRLPEVTYNHWMAPEAAWARPHGPDFLQSVLDEKAGSYEACRLRCDEVWLIILSGTERLASMVQFAEGTLQQRYATPFDRAFLFEDGRHIHSLSKAITKA